MNIRPSGFPKSLKKNCRDKRLGKKSELETMVEGEKLMREFFRWMLCGKTSPAKQMFYTAVKEYRRVHKMTLERANKNYYTIV